MALMELWLPILVSAVFVFVVSSVVHMALPIHKSDFAKVPDEDAVSDALRAAGIRPGEYMFPFPESMKDLGSPEFQEKRNRGPVGFLTMLPSGPCAMGKPLMQWFAFCLVIGVTTAYLAAIGLTEATASGDVFRFTATASLLGYAFSSVTNSIWKGTSWVVTAKFLFDGLLYALATGAAFAWLWPSSGA